MMTENCIVCTDKAICWTGHVLNGKQMITAGWCKLHKEESENINRMFGPACFGEWFPQYGLRDYLDEV